MADPSLRRLKEEAAEICYEWMQQHPGQHWPLEVQVLDHPLPGFYATVGAEDGRLIIWLDSTSWPHLTKAQRRWCLHHEMRHVQCDSAGNVVIAEHDFGIALFAADLETIKSAPLSIRKSLWQLLDILRRVFPGKSVEEIQALIWRKPRPKKK